MIEAVVSAGKFENSTRRITTRYCLINLIVNANEYKVILIFFFFFLGIIFEVKLSYLLSCLLNNFLIRYKCISVISV